MTLTPELERQFWEHVDRRGPDECWNWLIKPSNTGYGRFHVGVGHYEQAHRVSYELLVGPIPAGLHIDHLCRNRACVNPAHLEPVTCKVNVLRGTGAPARNARKTECKWGHPFTPENTIRRADGCRECRACWRELQRNSKLKQRLERPGRLRVSVTRVEELPVAVPALLPEPGGDDALLAIPFSQLRQVVEALYEQLSEGA